MAIALLTNYLAPYRLPLYERLAAERDIELLLYGGGERYVPPWFADLDAQIAAAPFPARRFDARLETTGIARHYEMLIAPFAGGAVLPAAYLSARRYRRRFILWASVWAAPRSPAHALAAPITRRIYRGADAIVAYGEHARRFAAAIRGRDSDIFIAPQSVEPELFARAVAPQEIDALRREHSLGDGPLVVYSGRLVEEKGVGVLLDAWRGAQRQATLVIAGDGPLRAAAESTAGVRVLGAIARERLAVVYAAAEMAVLPSLPTPRFREPWGLVVNEAMHQGRPVIVSEAVGAAAGGLVRDGKSGIVVPAGDPAKLAAALDRLLGDAALRGRLGAGARAAVAPYTYEAMVAGFDRAIAQARR